jgi:hypothetical protein
MKFTTSTLVLALFIHTCTVASITPEEFNEHFKLLPAATES